MLCVEDYLDTLQWAKSIGGLKGADRARRCQCESDPRLGRAHALDRNLAADPNTRSNTSVCLKIVDPAVTALPVDAQWAFVKDLVALVEKEGVAYDIANHRDALPGLRIWCGATVETQRCRGAAAVARLGLCQSQGSAAEGGLSSFHEA